MLILSTKYFVRRLEMWSKKNKRICEWHLGMNQFSNGLTQNRKRQTFRLLRLREKMMLSSLDVWICECSLFHFRCYQLCRCVGTGAQIPRKRICNVSFKNSEAVGFFILIQRQKWKESGFWTEKENCLCFVLQMFQLHPGSGRVWGWLVFRKGRDLLIPNYVGFFVPVHMYLQNLALCNGSRYAQCLITVWKGFFSL